METHAIPGTMTPVDARIPPQSPIIGASELQRGRDKVAGPNCDCLTSSTKRVQGSFNSIGRRAQRLPTDRSHLKNE